MGFGLPFMLLGLAGVAAYWLMQLSLLGSAWLMWRAILARGAPSGPALLALATTIGQMGLLGALIVFAPVPLYLAHFASTAAWGLTPLADQQLAGQPVKVVQLAVDSKGLFQVGAGGGQLAEHSQRHPQRIECPRFSCPVGDLAEDRQDALGGRQRIVGAAQLQH